MEALSFRFSWSSSTCKDDGDEAGEGEPEDDAIICPFALGGNVDASADFSMLLLPPVELSMAKEQRGWKGVPHPSLIFRFSFEVTGFQFQNRKDGKEEGLAYTSVLPRPRRDCYAAGNTCHGTRRGQ